MTASIRQSSIQSGAPAGPLDLAPSVDRLATLAIMAAFCVMIVVPNWGGWAVDFSSLYYAGYFFSTGEWDQVFAAPRQVIGPDMPPRWEEAVAAMGYEGEQTYPFIYPPWVAAAMAPIAMLFGPMEAMNGMLILNSVQMMLCIYLAYRIMSPLPMQLWLWTAVSAAIMFSAVGALLALALGQAQLVVFTLCLFAFERLRAGHGTAAGVALAFAAMLKLTPLFLGFVFLWNREWRALRAFILTGTIGTVLAIGLLGWDLHQTYLDRLSTISDHIYLIHFAYSMEAFIYQMWDFAIGTAPVHDFGETYYLKPDWIAHTCKAGLFASIALVWAATAGSREPHRMQRQFLALALAIPLFAPLGWAHYYLLAMYLLPGIVVLMPVRAAVLLVVFVALSQTTPVRMLYNPYPTFFFPDIIVSVPVYFALFLSVLIAQPRKWRRARASGGATTVAAE